MLNSIKRINESKKTIEEKKEKVEEIRVENETLKKELNLVSSELYVEMQLRDKLGLAREGEIVVSMPEDDVLKRLVRTNEIEEDVLPKENWEKWLDLFI